MSWPLVLLLGGILLVLSNRYYTDIPSKIEYRYLPRDLDTYIRDTPGPATVFGAMFTEQDVIRGGWT